MKRPIVFDGNVAKIQLTRGYWAEVDLCDAYLVSGFNWYATIAKHTVYATTKAMGDDGKRLTLYMHRVILNAKKGDDVDHKDHNGINNKRENLRICNRSKNQMNTRLMSNNKSGLKGATWCKKKKKWRSTITINGRGKFIGYFDTKEAAHEKYCEMAIKRDKEFHCFK